MRVKAIVTRSPSSGPSSGDRRTIEYHCGFCAESFSTQTSRKHHQVDVHNAIDPMDSLSPYHWSHASWSWELKAPADAHTLARHGVHSRTVGDDHDKTNITSSFDMKFEEASTRIKDNNEIRQRGTINGMPNGCHAASSVDCGGAASETINHHLSASGDVGSEALGLPLPRNVSNDSNQRHMHERGTPFSNTSVRPHPGPLANDPIMQALDQEIRRDANRPMTYHDMFLLGNEPEEPQIDPPSPPLEVKLFRESLGR